MQPGEVLCSVVQRWDELSRSEQNAARQLGEFPSRLCCVTARASHRTLLRACTDALVQTNSGLLNVGLQATDEARGTRMIHMSSSRVRHRGHIQ